LKTFTRGIFSINSIRRI